MKEIVFTALISFFYLSDIPMPRSSYHISEAAIKDITIQNTKTLDSQDVQLDIGYDLLQYQDSLKTK